MQKQIDAIHFFFFFSLGRHVDTMASNMWQGKGSLWSFY
jgi:hypothetical protein